MFNSSRIGVQAHQERASVAKMDFQKVLLEVGKALSRDEVKALAFLCADLLNQALVSVKTPSDLFLRLADRDHLSVEKPDLLSELLYIINRMRLARDHKLTASTTTLISPYRKLLYSLSEELTEADLKSIKFMLNSQLPRRKLEEDISTLEVFLELEHMDLINETNLGLLESIIQPVCPVLMDKILKFKAEYRECPRPFQQTSQHRPQDSFLGSPEILAHFEHLSIEVTEPQQLSEFCGISSQTSVDRPSILSGGDESENLPQALSSLSTESSSYVSFEEAGSNDLVVPPQENNSYSKKFSTDKGLATYPMNAVKRGFCVIINNEDFTHSEPKLHKREGTMMDERQLQKVFQWLGFEIETHKDCTSEKILSVMQDLSSRDHSQMNCLVCCILSHGKEGCVYGVDGSSVTIRRLMDLFGGNECPSLVDKPKLFFIQACQGNQEQKRVFVEPDGPTPELDCRHNYEAKDSIPSDADFLLGMATVPSFVSYRDKISGTWFIQSLCQNLVQLVPRNLDLVAILTYVNADVSKKTDFTGLKKQMPQPAFTLTKRVVFPTPRTAPPVL